MFDWILNTPLAGSARENQSLKVKVKIINFTLKKVGKQFFLYSKTYLGNSRISAMELFC